MERRALISINITYQDISGKIIAWSEYAEPALSALSGD